MLNSAVFNFAWKNQIRRFIYHKLDMATAMATLDPNHPIIDEYIADKTKVMQGCPPYHT